MELPSPKLSEEEKEAFKRKFEAIKSLLDDTCEAILEMERDQARRYYQLIVEGLQEADVKLIGGAKSVAETAETSSGNEDPKPKNRNSLKWGDPLPPGAVVLERRDDGSRVVRIPMPRPDGLEFRRKTNGPPNAPQYVDVVQGAPVKLGSPPDFDGFFNQLIPEAQEKARRLLDCVKEFYRTDGPGIKIICRDCTLDALQRCLRAADPSIRDPLTELIKAESVNPR